MNQELIELDLFHFGLAKFSVDEFEAAGLDAEDRFLIQFMAEQESVHAQLLQNILGGQWMGITEYYSSLTMLPTIGAGAQQCTYQYPFNTVREFVDFCQKVVYSCISAASLRLTFYLS